MQTLIVRAAMTVKQDSSVDVFRALIDDLARSARALPGTLQYEVFFDAEYRNVVFLEQYADDAAFLARRNAVAPESRKDLYEMASIASFEVYGDPGDEVTSLLGSAQVWRQRV